MLGIGAAATVLLLLGERRLPGKPVGLAVVALSILTVSLFGLADMGLPVTGKIPTGLLTLALPTFGLLEFDIPATVKTIGAVMMVLLSRPEIRLKRNTRVTNTAISVML